MLIRRPVIIKLIEMDLIPTRIRIRAQRIFSYREASLVKNLHQQIKRLKRFLLAKIWNGRCSVYIRINAALFGTFQKLQWSTHSTTFGQTVIIALAVFNSFATIILAWVVVKVWSIGFHDLES